MQSDSPNSHTVTRETSLCLSGVSRKGMCSCYSFLLTPTHPIDCQGSVFAVCPLPTIQAELAEDVNHQPKLRRKTDQNFCAVQI